MKCLITICSKNKDTNLKLLPAHQRYLAPHIQQTYEKSQTLQLPFYILSGKYGLIEGDENIPSYDYYLEADKVKELSIVIARQIQKLGITTIDFLCRRKGNMETIYQSFRRSSSTK